jgi:hypothetical protein
VKRSALEGLVAAVVLLGGMAILGNLNNVGDYVFCVGFGVLYMVVRFLTARRAARTSSAR